MPRQRITAVIPYYNNNRTLRRCLDSFANKQTHPLSEIIVVDDGSHLPAKPIVEAMQLSTPVRVVQADHAGQSKATNVGIETVDADIALLTCADIVAVPDFVRTHVVEHERAKAGGYDVAVLGYIGYAPWLGSNSFLDYLSTDGPQFCFGTIADPDHVDGSLLYSPNCSVATERLREVGGFDEGFPYGFQDTDLGLRLAARGVRFVYRRQAYAHHDHPTDVAAFSRRNRSIGHYMGRMAERYPNLFPSDVMRHSTVTVADNPGLFERLLLATRRLERGYARHQAWKAPKARETLHMLYRQTTGCAFTQGVLCSDERIAPFLRFSAEEWASVSGRYRQLQAAMDAARADGPGPTPASGRLVANQQALA